MDAPDIDAELGKLLGAQQAATAQALASTNALADMLNTFRIRLIAGGMPPKRAVEMTVDYFAALLDRISGTEAAPED